MEASEPVEAAAARSSGAAATRKDGTSPVSGGGQFIARTSKVVACAANWSARVQYASREPSGLSRGMCEQNASGVRQRAAAPISGTCQSDVGRLRHALRPGVRAGSVWTATMSPSSVSNVTCAGTARSPSASVPAGSSASAVSTWRSSVCQSSTATTALVTPIASPRPRRIRKASDAADGASSSPSGSQ